MLDPPLAGRSVRTVYDDLLRAQWLSLRTWLGDPAVLAARAAPSNLDGWNVAELIAHIGRSVTPLSAATPAPDQRPLLLGDYVSAYAAAAPEIAAGTRELASDLADDLLAGIDRLWADGLNALARLPRGVVVAARGPIDRDDLVITRLLELVVHSHDFAESLPELPPPEVMPAALAVVVDALADVYRQRTDRQPEISASMPWLMAAAGRLPSTDPSLPLL